MAAPPHPTVLPSGPGKALALVPGGGGQVQPIHVLQNSPQSSVTMVRVVTSGPLTSNPPNGYSVPSVGGAEGNSELRGTAMGISFRSALSVLCDMLVPDYYISWSAHLQFELFKAVVGLSYSIIVISAVL